MWNYVISWKIDLLHRIDNMEQVHWIIFGLAILFIGAICMRGFGSAQSY